MIMAVRATACPEEHNPTALIAWIEENISLRPRQR